MPNIIARIAAQLPVVAKMPRSAAPGVSQRVEEELAAWEGRRETEKSMWERLKLYWDTVPSFGWDGSVGVPWSAVFVSHVVGGDFPASASHYKYVKKAMEDDSPWEVYSVEKNLDKVELQPGDVLVKPRGGSDYNSHGAVVYKVENGVAEVVGGNVGNTAKVEDRIPVDDRGRPTEGMGPWLLIMKRRASPLRIVGGIAGLLAIIAAPFAAFRIFKKR